jgi:hypothetical protein
VHSHVYIYDKVSNTSILVYDVNANRSMMSQCTASSIHYIGSVNLGVLCSTAYVYAHNIYLAC